MAVTGYSTYSETGPVFTTAYDANPRVVAKVKADGTVDTTTLLSDSLAPTFIGGAVIAGNDVWITGTGMAGGPVQYIGFGNALVNATGGTPILLPNEHNSYYTLRIFDGQLYGSSLSGAILHVASGLPKLTDQTATPVVTGIKGAFEFEFVDLDGQPGAERLYVAADGTGAADGVSGGVKKYVYDAAAQTWTLATTFTSNVTSGVRGLAAYKDGTNVVVLATTAEGDKLLRFVDDGSASPSSTVVATAPAGVLFHGVSNAPKP
ncbi:MAG: hypothetical protein K0S65_1064 [Labilithrix sp.]|nr:hypothetical protein [Labilithrix sp.]